jgi:hypothetical protein
MSELEPSIAVPTPEQEVHRLRNELMQIACKLILSARIISRLALCPGDDALAAIVIAGGTGDNPAVIPAGVDLQEKYEIRLDQSKIR